MARTRRAATSKTSKSTSATSGTSKSTSAGDGSLACPDCGKTFTRAASLGAHRNRAHGVAGASTRSRRTRARRAHSNGSGTTSRSAGAQTTRQQTTGGARGRSRSSDGGRSGVNRDALLQSIFPNGVPAREEVIRRANAWLDEAEQLARAK